MQPSLISPNAQILPQKSWWEQLNSLVGSNPQRGTPGFIPEFRDTFVGQLGTKLGMNQGDLDAVQMMTGVLGNLTGSPLSPRSDPSSMGMGMNLKDEKNLSFLGNKLLESIKRLGASGTYNRTAVDWGPRENALVSKEFIENKYPTIAQKTPITVESPTYNDLMSLLLGKANLGYFRPKVLSTGGISIPNSPNRSVIIKALPGYRDFRNELPEMVGTGSHEMVHGLSNQNIIRNTKFPIIGQSGGRDIGRDYIQAGRGPNEMSLEELFSKTPTYNPSNPLNVEAHKGLHDYFRMKAYMEQPEERIAFKGGKTGENAFNKVVQHIHDQKVKDYKVLDLTAPLNEYSSTMNFLNRNNLISDSDRTWIMHQLHYNPNATLGNVISPTALQLKLRGAGITNVRIKGRFKGSEEPTIQDIGTPMETLWRTVKEEFEAENPGLEGKFPKK